MANDVKATTSRSKSSTKKSTTTPAAKAATAGKTSTTATAKPRSNSKGTGAQITAADRLRHIEMAAYYLAEKRGFCDGNPADDWYAAERQIDHMLLTGAPPA